MKIFKPVLLLLALISISTAIAQSKQVKLQQFNNFTAQFEVPAGKTWVIEKIFSNFTSEVKVNPDGSISTPAVRIFIKTLNGDIKTDWQGNRFGPQVFQSNNTSATISFPITLPALTKFSLVIVEGDPGACKAFSGSGYISYTEISNK
ncbi:MAG: hypothetical protein ABJG68_01640 [Crocinitomicaceae bacterium]